MVAIESITTAWIIVKFTLQVIHWKKLDHNNQLAPKKEKSVIFVLEWS